VRSMELLKKPISTVGYLMGIYMRGVERGGCYFDFVLVACIRAKVTRIVQCVKIDVNIKGVTGCGYV